LLLPLAAVFVSLLVFAGCVLSFAFALLTAALVALSLGFAASLLSVSFAEKIFCCKKSLKCATYSG